MVNFKKMVEGENQVPTVNMESSVNSEEENVQGSEGNKGEDNPKPPEPKKAPEKKKRPRRETSSLGIVIDKEDYDKLKTLSWKEARSINKIVAEIIKKSLCKVEIDPEDVKSFDDFFKSKRRK